LPRPLIALRPPRLRPSPPSTPPPRRPRKQRRPLRSLRPPRRPRAKPRRPTRRSRRRCPRILHLVTTHARSHRSVVGHLVLHQLVLLRRVYLDSVAAGCRWFYPRALVYLHADYHPRAAARLHRCRLAD